MSSLDTDSQLQNLKILKVDFFHYIKYTIIFCRKNNSVFDDIDNICLTSQHLNDVVRLTML